MKNAIHSDTFENSPTCDTFVLQTLIQHGILPKDYDEIFLIEHKKTGKSIQSLLLESGMVRENDLLTLMAKIYAYCPVDLSRLKRKEYLKFARLIPYPLLEKHLAFPFHYEESSGKVHIAMADLSNFQSKDELMRWAEEQAPPLTFLFFLAKKSDILSRLQSIAPEPSWHHQNQMVLEDQMIHPFLYDVLVNAVQMGASDVHFQPEKFFLRVRYRCDGLLQNIHAFHESFWQPLSVQIKILSEMDISEIRRPQDGRFSLSIMGRSVDFRVSSHPTIYGENLVLRILDQKKSITPLKDLGYSSHHLGRLQQLYQRPEGLVIFTGPTGSGKTTSLYSMLAMLDREKLNIMTLEEPVECHLSSIRQTEIKDPQLLEFASGIHSILRQDPDVILIGEIRDEKTAEMALRASMTGHLVFTTLHTTHAIGTLYRLKELGISLSLLSGILSGVVAQRLVRKLCPECKESIQLTEQQSQVNGIWPQRNIFGPKGCASCRFTGYDGRRAIAEILIMTPWLEELLFNQSSYDVVQRALAQSGFRTLGDDARNAVLTGETSLQEVHRVIGAEMSWSLPEETTEIDPIIMDPKDFILPDASSRVEDSDSKEKWFSLSMMNTPEDLALKSSGLPSLDILENSIPRSSFESDFTEKRISSHPPQNLEIRTESKLSAEPFIDPLPSSSESLQSSENFRSFTKDFRPEHKIFSNAQNSPKDSMDIEEGYLPFAENIIPKSEPPPMISRLEKKTDSS